MGCTMKDENSNFNVNQKNGVSILNKEVYKYALQLCEQAKSKGKAGRKLTSNEIDNLNKKLGNILPSWIIKLYSEVPLCGLEITTRYVDSENEDDYIDMEIADDKGIISEAVNTYPGMLILEKGYINFANDLLGSGDQIFISINGSYNPPVYQIYHDVSDEADKILAEKRLVARSLSELFQNAKID